MATEELVSLYFAEYYPDGSPRPKRYGGKDIGCLGRVFTVSQVGDRSIVKVPREAVGLLLCHGFIELGQEA